MKKRLSILRRLLGQDQLVWWALSVDRIAPRDSQRHSFAVAVAAALRAPFWASVAWPGMKLKLK
jgi:hypothetical protein